MKKLAVLALGVFIAACSETPTETPTMDAPPVAFSNAAVPDGWFEDNRTTPDNCNGELVDWTTRRIDRVSFREDGAGGFHFSLVRTWIGTGVGQVTGTEYILNWPNTVSEHIRPPFPHTFTQVIANNLVSTDGSENRIFRLVQHRTVNANGELTSDVADLTLECVG